MDLRTFSPPSSLTIPQIHQWLGQVWPVVRMGTLNVARVLQESALQHPIEGVPPSSVKALAKDLAQWGKKNKLFAPHPHGGTTFSLDGVSFIQSSLSPRKPPKAAWDEFVSAHARAQWVNNAPEHLFPLKVVDVLLFGSMTRPTSVDHGDCDGVLVYQPKSEAALNKAGIVFQSPAFQWARPVSNYASYRYVLDKAVNDSDKFCRLVSDGKTLDVLYDHNPSFAIVSLNGRQWGGDLYHTQLDEVFDVVQASQSNADPTQIAHVVASYRTALRRFGGLDVSNIAQKEVLPLLRSFPSDEPRQNFVAWWASLSGPGPLAVLLSKIPQEMAQAWRGVAASMEGVNSVWENADSRPANKKSSPMA